MCACVRVRWETALFRNKPPFGVLMGMLGARCDARNNPRELQGEDVIRIMVRRTARHLVLVSPLLTPIRSDCKLEFTKSMCRCQVWFTNRRTKFKKHHGELPEK